MSDLDEIISSGGESAPVETKEIQQPEAPEQPKTDPESEETRDEGGAKVPVAALQKEREKVRRYTDEVADMRREIAESNRQWKENFQQLIQSLQPKQQEQAPPDFFEAPEAAIDHRLSQVVSPLQKALIAQGEGMSRLLATEKHGEQAIDEAYKALAERRGHADFEPLYRQIMASPHPYGALVDWHKKEQVRQKIGDDPESFIEAEVNRRLAEKLNEGGNQPPAQNSQAMPSNFATARNVGNRSGPAWTGPAPLADIFARK